MFPIRHWPTRHHDDKRPSSDYILVGFTTGDTTFQAPDPMPQTHWPGGPVGAKPGRHPI